MVKRPPVLESLAVTNCSLIELLKLLGDTWPVETNPLFFLFPPWVTDVLPVVNYRFLGVKATWLFGTGNIEVLMSEDLLMVCEYGRNPVSLFDTDLSPSFWVFLNTDSVFCPNFVVVWSSYSLNAWTPNVGALTGISSFLGDP